MPGRPSHTVHRTSAWQGEAISVTNAIVTERIPQSGTSQYGLLAADASSARLSMQSCPEYRG